MFLLQSRLAMLLKISIWNLLVYLRLWLYTSTLNIRKNSNYSWIGTLNTNQLIDLFNNF